MADWVTTKHAMHLLGVGSTTIKRWADDGTLPSRRTVGGHRRYHRVAIERLLDQMTAAGNYGSRHDWADLLRTESDITRIRSEIELLRQEFRNWYQVANVLDDAMHEIQAGDENAPIYLIAAGRLALAVSAIKRSPLVKFNSSVALLATIGGREPSYRTYLIELCIRAEKMEVVRSEASASIDELVSKIDRWRPRLVALHTVNQCTNCEFFSGAVREISGACSDRDLDFVIGFDSKFPASVEYGYQCRSFTDLGNALARVN